MRRWVGIEEVGHNRGKFIDWLNRRAGNEPGDPYCAAAVGTALTLGHAVTPRYRGGLAIRYREPGSFSARDVLAGRVVLEPGDLAIWQHGETIRGHIGVVERVIDRRTIITIDANTSPGPGGSQDDGDGIWRKRYTISLFNSFKMRWFTRPTFGGPAGAPTNGGARR